MCYVSLWSNKRQHVIYITIYTYFLDGRLSEVGAIRRSIRIVHLWGLDTSVKVRQSPRKRTRGNDGTNWREQQNFHCLLFKSSALYYHQTPTRRCGHVSSPTQFPPITGQRNMQLPPSLEWHVWSSSTGNDCHAVHRTPCSGASLCDWTVGF